MLSVALAALRSRRGQSTALAALACLVTAGAVGTPYFAFAAGERVIAQDVASAPPAQRSVALNATVAISTDGAPTVDHVDSVLRASASLPGTTAFTGLRAVGVLPSAGTPSLPVAYREGVCARVVIRGACPSGDRDVLVSAVVAASLGLAVGDAMRSPLSGGTAPAAPVRVVGIYTPADTSDPYWGDHLLTSTEAAGTQSPDAIFMTRAGLIAAQPDVVVERMIVLSGYIPDIDVIDAAYADIAPTGVQDFSAESDLPVLIAHIRNDTNALLRSVPVLAAEVVLLGWFALYIVLRALAVDQRADVGLVLLRGVPRRQMWSLFAQRNAIPVVVAAPFGAALGYLVARLAAGTIASATHERLAMEVAGGGLLLVLLGALIAASVADRRRRGTPITDLLRTTPPRRRGWRSDAVDIVVVTVAVLGVVQSHLAQADARTSLAVLVPALVALAAGLVAARLVAPVAGSVIARGLRSGRIATILTATYLARRPGLDRTFALLAVTTTMAATAVLSWHVASGAQAARARVDLGTDRILQVGGAPPVDVLTATRAADPAGRYLMAVTTYTSNISDTRVVAVDSTRLDRVMAAGADAGGRSATELARLLRPTPPSPVTVTGGALRLTVRVRSLPAGRVVALVELVAPDGSAHTAVFGPLRRGATGYTARVAGCDGGCRFVALSVAPTYGAQSVGRPQAQGPQTQGLQTQAGAPATGAAVVFSALASGGSNVVPATSVPLDLTDRSRWRTTLDSLGYGPVLAAGTDGLTVALPPAERIAGGFSYDPRVYLVDAPVPLPAVVADGRPPGGPDGTATIRPFGTGDIPVDVVATQPVLPLVGSGGAMVDLDYALHATDPTGATAVPQIWLRADTPATVIAALRRSGLNIDGDATLPVAEARYRQQVPETVRRLSLALAAIGFVLAVIALLLAATVERRPRSVELAALRAQGVDPATVWRVATAGYAALCGGAVVVGVVAAAVVQLVRAGGPAVFSDGWTVLPPPRTFQPGGWVFTVVVCGIPAAAVAVVAASQLVRAVARRGQETLR